MYVNVNSFLNHWVVVHGRSWVIEWFVWLIPIKNETKSQIYEPGVPSKCRQCHYLALIRFLPFVHIAIRYYWLDKLVRSPGVIAVELMSHEKPDNSLTTKNMLGSPFASPSNCIKKNNLSKKDSLDIGPCLYAESLLSYI